MKTGKRRKDRNSEIKEMVRQKNLMTRFIRQIELEDPIEQEIMQMMLGYQLVPVR